MTYTLSNQTTPPIRTLILENLTTQTHLLTQLFTTISQPSSSINPASQLTSTYTAISNASEELSSLVEKTYEHQQAYRRLMDKKREVESLEAKVRGLIRELERGRGELEALVQSGREGLTSLERSEKFPLEVPVLLAHAQALSKHTSAPISSVLEPLDKAQYQPWPTEGAMRQGLLFQLQGSMSGVGDVGTIGDEIQQNVPAPVVVQQQEVIHHEEPSRRYDPNAVFALDLNSDDSDDD